MGWNWYCSDCKQMTYARSCNICGQTEVENRKKIDDHNQRALKARAERAK